MWLTINEKDARPIYLQIINQIKEQVGKGTLKPDDELPSVRELADSMGINMHTVRSAYLKLRDLGIINIRLGRRARIAPLQHPSGNTDAKAQLKIKIQEIITDGYLMGLSRDDLKKLIDKQLEQQKEV